MRKSRIPTILGLFILVFGLAAGLVLLQTRQIFKLGAATDVAPDNVRVSNAADTSFAVSWVTAKESLGFVKYGNSATNLDKVANDPNKNPSFTHTVSLSGLNPNTSYFFKINSGGQDFDNNGAPWQGATGRTLSTVKTNLVSGSVLTASGIAVENALVFIVAQGGAPLSTTTSKNGNWIVPISSARTLDLSDYAIINESQTLLEITVYAGPDGIAAAQIYPQSSRPAPPIILGQVNDFKNAPVNQLTGLPEASIDVPGEEEKKSGFDVKEEPSGTNPKTVTLESVDSGEVITSTKPEFFGEGPPGETIMITVESEAQTAEITVPSSGDWKWAPPAELEEGSHKVKISWRDTAGILRTIERTFIVQAAEGPAFVSTPSATTTASPTSTPKSSPTATPSGTAKATATGSATPTPTLDPAVTDSGFLTPTIALSIMGIGVLAFSALLWKKAEL